MKGVKYDIKIIKRNKTEKEICNLLMKDVVETLNEELKKEYKIEMNITRHIVYNIIHRKNKTNKILKQVCMICKSPIIIN